ncbi:hypothetical protein Prum_002370 [Phytohabitans rumicis]|uniref:Pyrrolo-quinoline quinone repeat domain-containing protein n=2 Tax=Phytohabitans rumicis TaxID=1076125 RepID=A0A6V8L1J1_9ACTN|nr:hypothetical protein Prum_002370 [Phytohabitans rumicis]
MNPAVPADFGSSARTSTPPGSAGGNPLAWLAGAWARAVLAREGDAAGAVTLPWLTLSVLAMVELVGQIPSVRTWTTPSPSFVNGVARAAEHLGHAPAPLAAIVDPLRAWVQPALPATSTWLAVAAVPVLLVSCLAVVRQYRQPTVNARALRLAALLVGGAVMVAYVLHLAATVLAPIAVGVTAVHTALLVGLVIGSGLLFRLAVGRRTATDLPPAGRRRRRVRRAAVACAAVVALAIALSVAPKPTFWPVLALPGTALAGHAALLAGGRAYFATGTPGILNVTAVDRDSGERRWSRQLRRDGDAMPASVRLSGSSRVLLVDDGVASTALRADDGHPLWTKPAGTVRAFGNAMILLDAAKATIAALDETTGAALWTRRHPAKTGLYGRTTEPGTLAPISALVQLEPDGTVRVLRPSDGAVLGQQPRLTRGAQRIWLLGDTLLWTLTAPSPRVVAYSTDDLTKPVWTAPTGKPSTVAAAPCGRQRICVADATGARAYDARTGRVAWRLTGARDRAFGGPDGTVVVWSGTETVLLDQRGTVLATYPDVRGYPLDGERVLLIAGAIGERGERERAFALFQPSNRTRQPLGRSSVDPAACAWEATHLACAGSTLRLWHLPT